MKLKILSLDFDGTLVHPNIATEEIYSKVFEELFPHEFKRKFDEFESEYLNTIPDLKNDFRNFGKLSPEDRKKLYYHWNNERLKFLFPNLSEYQRKQTLEEIMKNLFQNQRPVLFPEVKACLKYFKKLNLTLNILSGNNKKYASRFLQKEKLENTFNDIYTPDFLNMPKKDLFNNYKKNGNHLEEILHVGDDPELDYITPKSLGLKALWLKRIDHRYNDGTIPKEDVIMTLSDLKEIIENKINQ